MDAACPTELITAWFARCWGNPTAAQQRLWPVIERGQHAVLVAPTGGGKTLAALLPVCRALAKDARSGPQETSLPGHPEAMFRKSPGRRSRAAGATCSAVRALYLTPLRALCHDLEQKLQRWVHEWGDLFRVAALTGDTPAANRQMLRTAPPDLLITTPESLALWLSHPSAGWAFRGLRFVIVDEIHLLLTNKRGADLAISLERLARLAQSDPQRIGLSATVSPLSAAAAWLGGGRPVTVVSVSTPRGWRLAIEHLPEAGPGRFLANLLPRLEARLKEAQSTLVFTNVRSLAERLAWLLRQRHPAQAERVAVHHSALAPERRREIEQRLFRGELWTVFSSTSLEAGVDIGNVDQVILIHPPGETARLLQRLGRAGHRPGGQANGVVFTTQPDELMEVVVTRAAGQDAWLEPIAAPTAPLDVLCQQLVGLAVGQPMPPAAAFALVRQAQPFQSLSVADFAACLAFLLGLEGSRRTPARLRISDHRLRPHDRRVARLYRQNAGTIITEPTTTVLSDAGQCLGTVSAIFADTLRAGDRLLLAGRSLEVERRHGAELAVREVAAIPRFTRWFDGGFWSMSLPMAQRLWRFRTRVRDALIDGTAKEMLSEEYGLDVQSIKVVLAYLEAQEAVSEIPDEGLLVESVPLDGGEVVQHALHLPFPAMAAAAIGQVVVRRLFGHRAIPVLPGRLGCLLLLPAELDLNPDDLRTALMHEHWERDLIAVTADHPSLAQRFHAAAGNGLMLLRQPLGRRIRVGGRSWVANKLLRWLRVTNPRAVLFRQAMTETLREDFHCEAVLAWLTDLRRRTIRQRWLQQSSPIVAQWANSGISMAADLETTLLAAATPIGAESV